MNRSLARIGASLIFSGLFVLLSGTGKAQTTPPRQPTAADAATVTYIGSQEGSYIFDVQFENPAGETYIVAVVDDAGNTLFKGLYSDRKFDRKFRISPDEEIDNVSFVIRNLRNNTSSTYAVNTTLRSVEDVTVKRTH